MTVDPIERARHYAFEALTPSRGKSGAPTCPGHGVKRADLNFWGSSFDVPPFSPQLGKQAGPDSLQALGVRRITALPSAILWWRTDRAIDCDCRIGIESESANSGFRFDIDGVTKVFSAQFGVFAEGQPPIRAIGYYLGQPVVSKEVPLVDRYPGGRTCHDVLLDAWHDGFTCVDRVDLVVPIDSHPRLVGLLNWTLRRKPFYVALTFDYGPNPVRWRTWDHASNTTRSTALLLNQEARTRGTFFLERVNLATQGGRDMVAELHRSGHELAISTVDPSQLHCMHGAQKQLDPACGPDSRACFDRYLKEIKAELRAIDPTIEPRFVRAAFSENSQCKFLADRNKGDWPTGIGRESKCQKVTEPDADFTWSDYVTVIRDNGLQLYLRGGTRVIPEYKQRKEHGPTGWAVQSDDAGSLTKAKSYIDKLLMHAQRASSTACLVVLAHDFKTYADLREDKPFGGYLADVNQLLGSAAGPGTLLSFIDWLHAAVEPTSILQFVTMSELAEACDDQLRGGYRDEGELAAIKCPVPCK